MSMVMSMDCIFCKIIKGNIPSYKIYEDEYVYAFLDVNPISTGHTLIVPKEHTLDSSSITDDELNHVLKAGKIVSNLLQEKLNTDGMSFAQNNGIAQEVKHFHLHVIPKYSKKVNLSLEDVYKKITQ